MVEGGEKRPAGKVRFEVADHQIGHGRSGFDRAAAVVGLKDQFGMAFKASGTGATIALPRTNARFCPNFFIGGQGRAFFEITTGIGTV
jgi:hypothetical protein